jgi:5'-nucleotidase
VRILVTNDDGIDSEGLHVLARAMTAHGSVTVVAPDDEYSGAGASLGALQRIQPEVHVARLDGLPDAWAVTGPPALCVMFARLGAFGPPFDLVVAGINPGINVGRSVYHSGTVGAALTARVGGMSGVAVSQAVQGYGVEGQGWDEMLTGQVWDSAAAVASTVVGALAGKPVGPVVVNLNVPNLPVSDMAGWRHTSVGRVPPRVVSEARLEPKVGHPGSYRVEMSWGDTVSLPDGTDGGAVERGQVSVSILGALGDFRSTRDNVVEQAAETAISRALDELLGGGRPDR